MEIGWQQVTWKLKAVTQYIKDKKERNERFNIFASDVGIVYCIPVSCYHLIPSISEKRQSRFCEIKFPSLYTRKLNYRSFSSTYCTIITSLKSLNLISLGTSLAINSTWYLPRNKPDFTLCYGTKLWVNRSGFKSSCYEWIEEEPALAYV
jgi:hypothetical protein